MVSFDQEMKKIGEELLSRSMKTAASKTNKKQKETQRYSILFLALLYESTGRATALPLVLAPVALTKMLKFLHQSF